MKGKKNTKDIKTPTAQTNNDDASILIEVAEQLTRTMEKTRIAEYVEYLHRPWKLLWMNFLIGIARGLGGTIGLAVVLGIAIFVLQKVIMLNLPVIGDYITSFIHMIQENLQYLSTKN